MRRYFTFAPISQRSLPGSRDFVTSSVVMLVMDHAKARPLDFREITRSKITKIKHRIDISKRRVLIGVQDADGRRLPNPCLSIRMLMWNEWGSSRERR